MDDAVRAHIERYGQHLRRVTPASGDPPGTSPFIYTIGNHESGLPELLIVGPVGPEFGEILNRLGEIQRKRGKRFAEDELVNLGGKYPVRVVDAGEVGKRDYAVQVGVYYGTDDFQVQQILICDPNGRWPDDPNCEAPYNLQPTLGRVS